MTYEIFYFQPVNIFLYSWISLCFVPNCSFKVPNIYYQILLKMESFSSKFLIIIKVKVLFRVKHHSPAFLTVTSLFPTYPLFMINDVLRTSILSFQRDS